MRCRKSNHSLKFRSSLLTALTATALLGWTLLTGQAAQQQKELGSIDIPALVTASELNGAALHRRLPEFTYIQKRITRELGRDGKISERTREYEAYPTRIAGRHRHILSLISRDGVAVPPDQIEKNRLNAAGEMEKAERAEAIGPDSHGAAEPIQYVTAGIGIGDDGTGIWLSASQFLHHCRFADPRRTQLDGRETIQLVFYGCRVSPPSPREDYLERVAGIAWIDETDRVLVRIEAWPSTAAPTDILSTRPADPVIVYEQKLIQDGVWAPSRIRLNGIGKSAIFNGVDKDMVFEFSEYRHFSTEIRDPDIADPKKRPIPPR